MSNEFNPKKIIDFEKDYYEILGISKESFPNGKNRQAKIKSSEILEAAFRKKARTCHPDFGGSKEAFLDIVRARRILEDPLLKGIYDQGYFEEVSFESEESGFEVDWSKVGTYRKGTPEDTIGFSLFLKICDNKENLRLVPAFFPSSLDHNYEWDWVIKEKNLKLVISIVNDENEVLRLTSGEDVNNSLPFKIYICIPRASLNMSRGNNQVLSPDGKTMIHGNITNVSYSDYTFLETTNLDTANHYIDNILESDLLLFMSGENLQKFLPVTTGKQTKWLDSEQLKKYDNGKLSEILNMRSFEIVNDERAADFLDKI
jgi:hypothetical protein